jgi:glycerate 2-kinase
LLERALAAPDALPGGALRVIAAGKASSSMAGAARRLLGSRIGGGLVVLPQAQDDPEPRRRVVGPGPHGAPSPFEAIAGGHPMPTTGSEQAGRRALALAASLQADETLVVLLSGGASALMAVPAAGVALDDKRATTDRLLRAGADIHALNTVRKHLSAIKGGWLAASAPGACRAFAISDVVGDDLSVIASGPTMADSSTFGDAIDVLRRFGEEGAYPRAVVARLAKGARGEVPETPKPGDPRLVRAASAVIGGRRDAMDGAAREAETLGYHVVRIDEAVVGEARIAAPSHLRRVVARAAGLARPACIVSSGETTVRVVGSGKGGRNQEFALASAAPLASLGGAVAAASAGTDGVDGPTDAAGAIVDATTVERARTAGFAPDTFLDNNNAYAFFAALGDLILTGPTDTNVGDLQIILLA